MTSDQFDEHADMLARLGSGPEAARLRTEMQTAGLASDMQAFKAANPGCILEDFVRWHSPKDWRPLDANAAAAAGAHSKRGELSQRMRKRTGAAGAAAEGGNIWHSLWKSSQPLAASEQPALFDPSVEGEHVLSWLENVEPSLLFSQLLGIALQNCLGLLARTRPVAERHTSQHVTAAIQKLHHYLKHFNRGTIPQGQIHSAVHIVCSGCAPTHRLTLFRASLFCVCYLRRLALRLLCLRAAVCPSHQPAVVPPS